MSRSSGLNTLSMQGRFETQGRRTDDRLSSGIDPF